MCSTKALGLSVAILLAAGSLATAQSLQTLPPNNGSGGVFMDLTPIAGPLDVTSFETPVSGAVGLQVSVEVWVRPGSYVGFDASNAGWTLHETVVTSAAGTTVNAPLNLSLPISLPDGVPTAVYLHAITTGGGIRYQGTGTTSTSNFANADLQLFSDVSRTGAIPFGGTRFSPRAFSGVVHYVPGGPPVAGACCFNDGTCQSLFGVDCINQGGSFQGGGTDCATANCPQPGACCLFDGSCTVGLPAACTASGGSYQGAGSVCGTCPPPPPVVYSNCNLTTGTTTLSGAPAPSGAEWSETSQDASDPTIANTIAGFGGSGALRLADDFSVPAGGMDLAYVKIPTYTTGASAVTITGATLRIWDGPPNDPASTVIFGDTTTNRLAAAEFTDIYRTFNTATPPTCGGALTAPDTSRRLQWGYITVDQFLPEGVYWLDWNYAGALWAPPATPATAIGRQCDPNNSNALQFDVSWVPANDTGQGCLASAVQQDMYFELMGTTGASCYANCDGSTVEPVLNVDDFTCFINEFAAAQALPHEQQIVSYANCDGSTVAPALNVDDFTCFINEFAAGCP